jgi:oligosaccharide reducing-end xylanase
VNTPLAALPLIACSAADPGPAHSPRARKDPAPGQPVCSNPGAYRNLFREIGLSAAEINAKMEGALHDFFKGDESLRCYYETGEDEAYIYDSGHGNVCSEGMSYGMMIAVQAGMKEEFDRLWNFTRRRLRNNDGDWEGYFSWQATTDGAITDRPPAPDGEEYFATALFFAWKQWGDTAYRKAADDILHHMLHQDRYADPARGVTPMIDQGTHQVVFVPYGTAAGFTDPSYHLPAFYELWSRWAKEDGDRWKTAATVSRGLLHRAAHIRTGLAPDYCTFDGHPCDPTGRGHEDFRHDAYRVMQNMALDCYWFGGTPELKAVIDRQLDFFAQRGIDSYGNGYTIDGTKQLSHHHSPGLAAMNATGALVSSHPRALDFVRDLWSVPPVTGEWRYYDGCLYLFGLLNCAGRFRMIGFKK